MKTSKSTKTKFSQTFKTNNMIYFDTIKSYKPYKECKVITVVLLIRAKPPTEDFSVKCCKFNAVKLGKFNGNIMQ